MGTQASVLVRASLYNQLCGTVARFWEPAPAKHRERHGRYGLGIGGDTTRNLEPKLLLGHHCTALVHRFTMQLKSPKAPIPVGNIFTPEAGSRGAIVLCPSCQTSESKSVVRKSLL